MNDEIKKFCLLNTYIIFLLKLFFKACLLDGESCPSSWTKWGPRKGCRQIESAKCGINGRENGYYTTQSRQCEELGKMGKTVLHDCLGGHSTTMLTR